MPTQTAEIRARVAFDTIATHLRLSNEKIAKRLGVSTSTVQAKRRGPTMLGLSDVELLAGVLEVPVEWFWLERSEVLRRLAERDERGESAHIVAYVDFGDKECKESLIPPPEELAAA